MREPGHQEEGRVDTETGRNYPAASSIERRVGSTHKSNMSCASSDRREVGKLNVQTMEWPPFDLVLAVCLRGSWMTTRNWMGYELEVSNRILCGHHCETATCHQSVHRVRFGTYAPQSYAASHPLSAPRARHCHTHLTTSPLRAGALESLSPQENLLKTPFKCVMCFGSTLLSPRRNVEILMWSSFYRQISLELCDKFLVTVVKRIH